MHGSLQNNSRGWRMLAALFALLLLVGFASPVPAAVTAIIDRNSGNLTVTNGGPGPLDFFGYTISSQFGGLNSTPWFSIANYYDRNAQPTPGNELIDANDSWRILSNLANRSELSEAELSIPAGNGGSLAVGVPLDLGDVWIMSPTEDVILRVLRTDGNVVNVSLSFSENEGNKFKIGDMNFNGELDPADWDIYISGALTNMSGLSGAERYQKGDFNNDGANNLTDMDLFIDAYDAANGVGAFIQLLAGVPEPGSCLLLVFGGTWLAANRVARRRTQRYIKMAIAVTMILMLMESPTIAIVLDPIATSGHDQDIIFEAGLTNGQVGANGELGSRQFFEDGATSPTDNGLLRTLPTFVAASGNSINFAFQPFEQNNILKFAAGTPTKSLTMVTPKPYSSLAIAFSGGALAIPAEVAALPFTINYQGGATQTGSLNVPDWGSVPSLPPGTHRLFTADRTDANETVWPIVAEGSVTASRWATYVSEITPTFAEPITSVTFHTPTLNGGVLNSGDDVVVFGLAGAPVTGPTTLNLHVNTTNGRLLINNPTADTISITAYEISSEDDALNVAGWASLSDQNLDPVDGDDVGATAGDGPGETWDEAPGASNSTLLEGRLFGSSAISPGGTPLDLGLAFNLTGEHDLVFRQRNIAGVVVTGTVSYAASSGVSGDYNDDGVVNAADYVVWRKNNHTSNLLPNDSSPNQVNDDDYLVWRANFGNSLGSGAVAVGLSAVVPEPGALILALLSLVGLASHRPRILLHCLNMHEAYR